MSNPDFKTFPITFLPLDQPLLVASINISFVGNRPAEFSRFNAGFGHS